MTRKHSYTTVARPRCAGTKPSIPVLTVLLMSAVSVSGADAKKPAADVAFEKHVLSKEFTAEAVAVGDVDHDGKTDVIAGCYWYAAPDWKPRAFRKPRTFNPAKGYSDTFGAGSTDVNGDGWIDYIRLGFPGKEGAWYENSRGKDGHWKEHRFAASVCNESPMVTDIDGDGADEPVFPSRPESRHAWWQPPRTAGGSWTRHPIGPAYPGKEGKKMGTHRFSHGLGVGDLDGDGRKDLLIYCGWFRAPADPRKGAWTFHACDITGGRCAHLRVLDADGDGDRDVISSAAHDYGLWWSENTGGSGGAMRFKKHLISKEFSQLHAINLADVDGDGLQDHVTGKRWYAHNGKDPGAAEPAVLYWFRLEREGGKPRWTPHRIDDDSGVGTQFVTADISGNKKVDIAVSNKKGTFVFLQK